MLEKQVTQPTHWNNGKKLPCQKISTPSQGFQGICEDLVHPKDRTRQEAWYVYSVYAPYRLILDIMYHHLSCRWFLGPQHNSQLRALHFASSRWKEASTCSCHVGLALWSKMITFWIQQKYGSTFGKQKVKVILQTAENCAGDNFESTCLGHDTFSAHRCSTYYCMSFFRFMFPAHVQNLNVWVSAWFHLQVFIPVSKLTLNSSRLHRFDRFKPWNMSIWVKCDPEVFNLLTCLDKVPGTSNIRPLKSRGLQKNYPRTLDPPPDLRSEHGESWNLRWGSQWIFRLWVFWMELWRAERWDSL